MLDPPTQRMLLTCVFSMASFITTLGDFCKFTQFPSISDQFTHNGLSSISATSPLI